ncbi:hypothetical protein ACIHEI_37325 [Kitasatospora sp. NPDC051984]|uniref:hypothetical protein n=1 Tax=Kitasatospora sp. NPDC051984 TaxID=3364059 RepID=UPI0037C9FCC5
MNNDIDTWHRFAALLPEPDAQDIADCWQIGEQEAGLRVLVSGLLTHQIPISETVRAQLSVLAEIWGEREVLTPGLLRCPGDGRPAPVALTDSPYEPDHDSPAEPVLVPWITCTTCGQLLLRAHLLDAGQSLSHLAEYYAIASPDGATVLHTFPAYTDEPFDPDDPTDPAGTAFAALLNGCAEPTGSH